MASIFTKIIQGEIPCQKILEDDQYFAFLDIRPISRGHTLVIPKQETDRFFDLSESLLSGILPFSKPIVQAIEAVIPCQRVGLMVAGLEVPHAHLHLVPINNVEQLSFAYAKSAQPEELDEVSTLIRGALTL